jgi:hypothetical protein
MPAFCEGVLTIINSYQNPSNVSAPFTQDSWVLEIAKGFVAINAPLWAIKIKVLRAAFKKLCRSL